MMLVAVARPVLAWGCEGHRTIALLAERYARPSAVAAAKTLLGAHPADAVQNQYCGPFPQDSIVESATWADDWRQTNPSTGPWHFINFPLAVPDPVSNFQIYCPSGQCVVAQIVRQFAVAKTSSDPAARARGLRFLIHLIGDIHQPLHAIDNGDRGGNCVPVRFFGPPPQLANGSYSPNLHGVWDAGLVTRLMQSLRAATPAALATKLAPTASAQRVEAAMPSVSSALAWAAEANALAKSIAYGKLPVRVPVEPASAGAIASCSDHDDVAQRMLALNEVLGAQYEGAARPVVRAQLVNAAKRLAAALDALFP